MASEWWYADHYTKNGLAKQRLYPNEELVRFISRRYGHIPFAARYSLDLLEVGCGAGSNLWALAREGFHAYGLDSVARAIGICREMLDRWRVSAELEIGDIKNLPYPAERFDCVVDVFSSYCLRLEGFRTFLREAYRVLKPGGRFFSYAPSKGSDAFAKAAAADLLDPHTLNGIVKPGTAYYGNFYPYRFILSAEYRYELQEAGFTVLYLETVARTYGGEQERVEFVVIEGQKA